MVLCCLYGDSTVGDCVWVEEYWEDRTAEEIRECAVCGKTERRRNEIEILFIIENNKNIFDLLDADLVE